MKTILIIDDEAYFSESVKTALDPKKYKVLSATGGEEGLKKIEELSPDAVLLDLNMPVLDGMGVLKKLREKKIKVPVLITSNLSSKQTISDGIALGVRGYIIKSDETPQTIADSIEDLFLKQDRKSLV